MVENVAWKNKSLKPKKKTKNSFVVRLQRIKNLL